ncbi:hypothetical protein B0H17DRAFT_1286656 [Mycena rosella]|uniref:Uncharacterized protein n=1 Tax=Mycena rosella TaxID=1033263 RepID=A0AAD7BP37_MYCRO|nr:hypothetical protein B0H17DRAFT_1286656 [Mycena rosella]
MEAELIRKDLWKVVEVSVDTEGKEAADIAKELETKIWNDLRDVHRARGFATSLALRRKFLTAKKKDDQSMQSWIGEIRGQAFTIEEATGTVVSDQDKILALTMGWPATFDPVIINFDSASPDT